MFRDLITLDACIKCFVIASSLCLFNSNSILFFHWYHLFRAQQDHEQFTFIFQSNN